MAHRNNNNNDPYARLDFNGAGSFDPPSPISSPSHMDPFNNNRTPSPGRPLQSRVTFQSHSPVYGEEHPQQQQQQPPNPYDAYGIAPQRYNTPGLGPAHANYYDDEMAVQPTYSVQNLAHSYHQQGLPQPQQLSGQTTGQQYQNPAYNSQDDFDDPYQPSPLEDSYPMHQYNEPGYDKDYDDSQPILSPSQAGFPEGQQDPGYFPPQSTTPVPTIKRWKTVKKVELYQGNLVLDCPVPKKLLSQMPRQNAREFTHMRYTAATCDPADFLKERFTLRQQLFSKPRFTELFIVVTMYNEDEILFARTMRGVIKNIQYMCSRTSSQTWGDEGWKKIVVCIVSDGRLKINPRTKSTLAAMGCYQDGIAKNQVGDKPVTAHIYEYTTQVNLEIKGDLVEVQPGGKNSVPMQVIFCLKEKNQKKINSHRWFFQAFGEVLDPSICVLIDAGTKPGGKSIYHLWKAFELNPECGGACGEIKAMLGTGWKHLRNPLVATQNFEYKMSNILDKPLESAFGFISVLPGAFSAYRFAALQSRKGLPESMKAGDVPEGPLEKYFKGETMHGANSTFFDANMYLAEDRILCFELVTKRNCNWVLTYVKSSYAETDVPDRMPELILQRRRWLNGSFFATLYALVHAFDIWRSKHSLLRKIMFHIEFTYQFIFTLFSWFALSNFFLVFKILTASLGEASVRFAPGRVLSVVFEWLYLGILLTCFILSLGNRPQGSNKLYMTMVIFWAIIMVYLLFAAVFVSVRAVQSVLENTEGPVSVNILFQNRIFRDLLISLCSTYVIYFVSSFLFWEPWHMFTSFLQYLLLSPSYVNVLNVYAFCNTHDISWGTKGDDKVATDLGVVKVQEGGKVDVNIPSDDGDLDAEYTKQVNILREKYVEPPKVRKPEEVQEDYYKGFRSSVVLLWMFTNFGLAAVVLNSAGLDRLQVGPGADERAAIYLSVVLWSVAALSLFRFFGSCWFLIIRMFRGV